MLAATAWDQLPQPAVRRLGARPAQKNPLVRVVLRDLEKTLAHEEANVLRDRIYRAVHQGTEYQWAVTSSCPHDHLASGSGRPRPHREAP